MMDESTTCDSGDDGVAVTLELARLALALQTFLQGLFALLLWKLVLGSSPRRSPPGGYSARVKGIDTQVRALES
jgi:hypothetical protein